MKKMGLICLALVVAMGALGTGYAMWYDTVTVSGPVVTATADVCLLDIASNEAIPGNPDPQWGIGNNEEGKDVARVSMEIVDCDEAIVTVHNAYPYYRAVVHYTVCNIGTIPVRWQPPIVTSFDPNVMVVNAWDGSQIHPGECNDFTFEIKILQTAEQDTDYTFTIQVVYVQWNEWHP